MMNVCVIGHFGGKERFQDGQTVKTHCIAGALEEMYPNEVNLRRVDTYYLKKNFFKFISQLVGGLLGAKQVILCVSKRGRAVFFPLLYWCSKLLGSKVYHCAVGGRLAEEIAEKKNWKRYIQAFCKNWVESRLMVENLKNQGVENAEYLPNFKKLTRLQEDAVKPSVELPISFCTFSRVKEEKGIGDAIQAVASINRRFKKVAATLDIYGPVDPDFSNRLEKLLSLNEDSVHYRGVAAPDKSVEVLKEYDILLFPTRYYREGIPGTIIDALSAGVPVIARRWKYCQEMLSHEQTGYCYEFEHPEQLEYWMEQAILYPDKIAGMKNNCLSIAEEYRMENVVPRIYQALREDSIRN